MAKLLIRLHFVTFPYPRTLTLTLSQRARGSYRGTGLRDSRLRGNDGGLREDDVCEQCSNRWGYGVRGSCRWFGVGGWVCVWGGVGQGAAGASLLPSP